MSTMTERQRFVAHWARFLKRFGKEDTGVLDVLLAQYGGRDRHYHAFWHINDALDLLEEVRRDMPAWFADPARDAAIELAIFEHDVVYNTRLDDNEKRSGLLAQAHALELGFDVLTGASAHLYIMATTHKAPAPTRDARIVCDIDLAPLAAPSRTFRLNTRHVRREYAQVPDDAFKAGRKRFFAKMLDRAVRPTIYQTEYFQERFEAAARANLERLVRES